jgi:hypothetical protein
VEGTDGNDEDELTTGKLWSIARVDLALSEYEFLSMLPVALELLMRRLMVRDRKQMTPGAMVSAELWNIARDRDKHPEAFNASDFLPELPEARRRREREEALAALPPTPEALELYKQRLFGHRMKKA